MALPEPQPGLVVRHDNLWGREAAVGRVHGKERPACLVATVDSPDRPRFAVILPITHTAPVGDTVGVEIPPRVRRRLGLDDAPCWVIVSEYNVDEWPSAGLAPLPRRPGVFAYGFVPPTLFARITARFLELAEMGRAGGVRR